MKPYSHFGEAFYNSHKDCHGEMWDVMLHRAASKARMPNAEYGIANPDWLDVWRSAVGDTDGHGALSAYLFARVLRPFYFADGDPGDPAFRSKLMRRSQMAMERINMIRSITPPNQDMPFYFLFALCDIAPHFTESVADLGLPNVLNALAHDVPFRSVRNVLENDIDFSMVSTMMAAAV